jgi:3-deoxy-D-manno-octulosonic-acid transferase
MYLLYSLLAALGMVLLLPYFLLKGLRQGKYIHNLRERMGYLRASFPRTPPEAEGPVWIHAVSVGEALAALPLARKLKERFASRRLVISTTTATGQQLARERFTFADAIFYFPLDWAGPVRRMLEAVRPVLVVIMETEIWPNFLREMRRAGVPVVFVNGRISARSFRRYRLVSGLLGGFIARVLENAELFLMQTAADAQRLLALGAPADRVEVTGNLKYDLAPPGDTPLATWLEAQVSQQERWPVVVAGSVVADEEEEVLAAFDIVQRKWRRALLILAPRKPERFDAAARIVAEDGWNLVRRSAFSFDAPLDDSADVLLLDSVGELAGLYRLADVTFVGGSLVPVGGHNILEPAWFARPPVFGPAMDNFREMAAQFLSAQAAVQVRSGMEMGNVWVELIEDAARCARMGRAARELVEGNRGATERVLERIARILAGRGKTE